MIECENCGFTNVDSPKSCANCGHFLVQSGEEISGVDVIPASAGVVAGDRESLTDALVPEPASRSEVGTPAPLGATSGPESPVIVLDPPRLRLDPGLSASLTAHVSNPTETLERLVIGVAGEMSKWARVDPRIVTVYPGSVEAVVVTFELPREGAMLAGDHDVRIGAESDSRGSTVVWSTATLEIAAFEDLWADLVPAAAVGSLSGRYELRITNGGNKPLDAAVSASAEGLPLRVRLGSQSITIDPGRSSAVSLTVSASRIRWLGSDRIPVSVRVATGESERTLVGMFEHRGVFAGSPSMSSLMALGTGAGLGIVAITAGVLR